MSNTNAASDPNAMPNPNAANAPTTKEDLIYLLDQVEVSVGGHLLKTNQQLAIRAQMEKDFAEGDTDNYENYNSALKNLEAEAEAWEKARKKMAFAIQNMLTSNGTQTGKLTFPLYMKDPKSFGFLLTLTSKVIKRVMLETGSQLGLKVDSNSLGTNYNITKDGKEITDEKIWNQFNSLVALKMRDLGLPSRSIKHKSLTSPIRSVSLAAAKEPPLESHINTYNIVETENGPRIRRTSGPNLPDHFDTKAVHIDKVPDDSTARPFGPDELGWSIKREGNTLTVTSNRGPIPADVIGMVLSGMTGAQLRERLDQEGLGSTRSMSSDSDPSTPRSP
ncbi:MAG: hypothetical protein Q7V63_03535 [Gammaproteobacteria bacterium]|nr:hypothetical protein [Gammaproteobacteria bacterium]